ncbi:hypothetical protein H0H92_010462 [Tricholoma furcatifolium]|nr:hypothetical protein H0H92_010462 [Tricholoma furcatifolium]
MADGASSKVSSLLNVLDSTYSSSGLGADTPTKPSLLHNQGSFQSRTTPGPSGSQDIREALRMAHASQRQSKLEDMADGEESTSHFLLRPGTQSFRLNYDNETPVRAIDLGGPDQEQRMADFVTKSIDNLSHGLTVRKAMDSLGLKEYAAANLPVFKKDLIAGMEVRLLAHQAIGVAWCVPSIL